MKIKSIIIGWIIILSSCNIGDGSYKPNDPKYKDCDIEYLPIAGTYYPRYKGEYLYYDGLVNTFLGTKGKNLQCICEKSKTKKGAIKILDRFLEQTITPNQIIKP